jgi:hypothetical protein
MRNIIGRGTDHTVKDAALNAAIGSSYGADSAATG